MGVELISVLVPVYNVRGWLPECLKSISDLTWTDWEAVLVDDGSTDGSGEICDGFAAEDSRFRVIHQENSGVSASRDKALSLARGKYVYFADADDCLHPCALEYLHSAICSGPYRMASADYVRVHDHGGWGEEKPFDGIRKRIVSGEECALNCVDKDDMTWLVVWNKLIDKSLLDGKTFEDIAQEDRLFVFRLFTETDSFIHLEYPLYAYMDRPKSLSKEDYYLSFKSDMTLFDKMLQHTGSKSVRAMIMKKSFRRYLTARYHAKGGEGKKKIREAFRPFFDEHGKEYLSSGDIPFQEKALSATLYLCPWAVWAYMKMTRN